VATPYFLNSPIDRKDMVKVLGQREFREICDLVYRECGISLNETKKKLVESRLSKRLRASGINSVSKYLRLIQRDEREKISFIDTISTNHTYFFRECGHFEYLEANHLSIWSAACSSGEEPYSIAIYCLEKGFRPTIYATDISTQVLETAGKGIYPMEKARALSTTLLKRYFDKGVGRWDGYIRVKNDVRKMVSFSRFNLINDMPPNERFDVVFCRNVLIYFDRKVKEQVISRLYSALRRNGYLIIGGAESLTGIDHRLKYISPSIYYKA